MPNSQARHPCAVCNTSIGLGFLMCASHWKLVPHAQQQAVYRTWGRFSRGVDVKARLAARPEYLAARDAAIEIAQAAIRPARTEATTGAITP